MQRAAAPKRDVVRARCSRPPDRPSISRPTATATVKTFLLSNHENFCSRRRLAVPKVGRQDGLVEVGRLSVGRWVWRGREGKKLGGAVASKSFFVQPFLDFLPHAYPASPRRQAGR